MGANLPPTVSIDGRIIRRIREEKKLTQLYVAKVVGVTTDTISRWENNRYPSIKRDNALLLAEALEVPVERFLKQEEVPEAEEYDAPGKGTAFRRTPLLLGGLVLAVVVLLWALYQRHGAAPSVVANRLLPVHAAPGSVIPVRVVLHADLSQRGFILREHFPVGWKLIEANPPASSLDNINGTARWIVKPGENRKRIVYLLRIDEQAVLDTSVKFSGEVVLKGGDSDGVALVGGDDVVTVRPVLWPDADANGIVDDAEILAASDVYEEMKGVHLNWDFLEKVWDAGGYKWQVEKRKFVVVKTPRDADGNP